MFPSQRFSFKFKPLFLHLKQLTTIPPLETLYLKHSTSTTSSSQQRHSFAISYLTNTFGFSPETALNLSERIRFDNPQKPDSVIAFFSDYGFTKPQITSIIKRLPEVLVCNPHKRLTPKFQFLLSKGASPSDIVDLVNRCPRIINSSLENNVIPNFQLVNRFLQSYKKTIDCLFATRHFLCHNTASENIDLLLDVGVKNSNIAYLLCTRPSMLLSKDLRKTIDEIKEMGFQDPTKISFVMALHAKKCITKSLWDAKVDACKSWGWSEEMVLDAFRRHPLFMLVSKDKINEVMKFWADQLGWDPLVLARLPKMFGYSLEGRIIPRGLVVRHLIAKGLRKKSASLLTPFDVPEKSFLENYVMRFGEEKCQLSKLYNGKTSLQENGEDGVASGS